MGPGGRDKLGGGIERYLTLLLDSNALKGIVEDARYLCHKLGGKSIHTDFKQTSTNGQGDQQFHFLSWDVSLLGSRLCQNENDFRRVVKWKDFLLAKSETLGKVRVTPRSWHEFIVMTCPCLI